MSSKMTRWRGIPTLAWIALIAALTGAGVLTEGRSPRAAWAQVGGVRDELPRRLRHDLQPHERAAFASRCGPSADRRRGCWTPAGLVVDTVNNEILVANVRLHHGLQPDGANGDAAPLRTISGAATGLARADRSRGGHARTTRCWSRTTARSPSTAGPRAGTLAPLRTISGPATRLMDPFGLAVDVDRAARCWSANFGAVCWAWRSKATPAASRSTAGWRTAMSRRSEPSAERPRGCGNPRGLALDTVNNQVLVVNSGGSDPRATAAARHHGLQPDGERQRRAAACRTISGAATGLQIPIGLAAGHGEQRGAGRKLRRQRSVTGH